jgi:chemotaxis response regulator CheB
MRGGPTRSADSYGAVVGRLRVVLADDNYPVRQGVAALLREVDTIELVDTVDSLDGLLRSVEENHPDVVLTDIRMPPSFSDEGIIAAKRIHANYSDTGVLVLSQGGGGGVGHRGWSALGGAGRSDSVRRAAAAR